MCFKYLSAFDKLCSSSDGIHVAILTLWLYKYWSHSTRFNISHSIISSHQQTEGIWEMLTKRLTGRLPVLPRRHCSLLYAEPDASRVCLNTHLIYIRFLLLSLLQFFFSSLFCSVISQRWRSDTFDNSGPCGVNTEVIAQRLCLRESTSISECLSPPCLFTDRQGRRLAQKGGKKKMRFWACSRRRWGVLFYCALSVSFFFKTKIKTCSFPGNTNGQFHKRYTSVTESW